MTATATTTHETITVGGTAFRFPIVPADACFRAAELLTERREKVLTAARKVRPTGRKRGPVGIRTPRPGEGTFTPRHGEPGSWVRLTDGRDVEVWSAGPGRSVFALSTDGTTVYQVSDLTGPHAPTATEIDGDEQRAAIIEGVAKAGTMGHLIRGLVPRSPSAKFGTPAYDAQKRDRDRAVAMMEDLAREVIAHDLFPHLYPAPDNRVATKREQEREHERRKPIVAERGQFALFDAA